MVKKSGLGKGLGVLVREADAETAGMKHDELLALSEIVVNKNQPRKYFNPDDLAELTASIKQHGVLQPILVRRRGAQYEIVAGERRYQASKLAGLDKVPVIIREISDEDVLKLALIENLQRANLTPMETARAYRQLLEDQDLTQEELAQVVSKSRSAITNTLRLLDLSEELQAYVESGDLTPGHARALLSIPNLEGRLRLAEKVVKERLSVRQTETLAPLFSVSKTDEMPRRAPVSPVFKRAQRQLRKALETNVKVRSVRGKNKVEIEFVSEEQLHTLVSLLCAHSQE